MTKITPMTVEELDAFLLHSDAKIMSDRLLRIPYSELKSLIYPYPRYNSFAITKRNGASRIINEPRKKLKSLQEILLAYLYEQAAPAKPCVHGFTPKRSIVTNAKAHCSTKTQQMLNIDLEDFFPSITFYRVRGLFQNKPFDFSHNVATVLAHLCTFNGVLPQGAPTSPLIANLICRGLDQDLMMLARRYRATYTRYADDITFSFSVRQSKNLPANICSFDSGILNLGDELKEIISTHSFTINPKKTRLSSRFDRLEVTGLTINDFPNVKRIFIDRIRGAIHAWEKYGYKLAEKSWQILASNSKVKAYDKRSWKRQTRTNIPPSLKNILRGKLLYLCMVRGQDDVIYRKLAERYNLLIGLENITAGVKSPLLPIDRIVKNKFDAEEAVFILEWTGDFKVHGTSTVDMVGGQGTAFAYKDVGLITCDHVLRYSGDIKGKIVETDIQSTDVVNAELTIFCNIARKALPVKILYRDRERDLAVLQVDLPNYVFKRHFGRVLKPILKDADGILIGFPNHTAGKSTNFLEEKVLNTYPRSGLNRFEITGAGSIRQGNSGGPFVDLNFRVAGVAQQGAKQDSGNDECLCVDDLDEWISKKKSLASQISNSHSNSIVENLPEEIVEIKPKAIPQILVEITKPTPDVPKKNVFQKKYALFMIVLTKVVNNIFRKY